MMPYITPPCLKRKVAPIFPLVLSMTLPGTLGVDGFFLTSQVSLLSQPFGIVDETNSQFNQRQLLHSTSRIYNLVERTEVLHSKRFGKRI